MTSPSISSATASDQQRAVSTIVMGFSSDPITRWFMPEPHQYLTYFAELVPLMAGGAFEHGSAYCTDDFMAASLWLPPGVHSDFEAMGELAVKAIAQRDQEKIFGFLGQMGEYHPTEPHWYLPLIAVDPAKLPAYLEATSPHNRRLYERHGFEAIGEIQSADSPPMWPMLRKPR
jgi:hypothetical protein